MINRELANRKVFSLNDLIVMGLITKEDVEKWLRYQEAKATVDEMFKGMF